MLDNTITWSVDDTHDSTPADQVYTRYDEYQNRTVYNGPGHALDARNQAVVTRSFPTVSGNFRGVAKSSLKFSEDVEVAGVDSSTTNVAPSIITVNFAIPVGTTAAQAMEMRQRVVAALNDEDFITRLTEELEV